MKELSDLINTMIKSIVDEPDKVEVSFSDEKNGKLFEVKVAKDDVGKIIGKKGRIAGAIRTVSKAAGAKLGVRVMLNILNYSE